MDITIVGGGFAGIKAALELGKQGNRVTLITEFTDFQYYPALYGTATGKSHLQSWVPLGTIFADDPNVHVVIDTISNIKPDQKMLTAKSGKNYFYETLILALGSVTTYFGIEGLDSYAFGIKSEAEIKKLKHHLAVQIGDNHALDKDYIVIGGGPTGVELAAALGSYIERLCSRYNLTNKKIKIHLVEAAPRILPRMSEKASRLVQKRLKKLGVVVDVGKKVESATADTLMVSGKSIKSSTVIWTSGVATNPFFKNNQAHFEFAPNGKIEVDDFLQTKDGIYVLGDNASTKFSGMAQTALHDALFVSKNINRIQNHKQPKKYFVVAPPVVVPVGENWAILEWHGLRITGWAGSILRRMADMIGYHDMLPLGQAFGVWRAEKVIEDDYFPASITNDKER